MLGRRTGSLGPGSRCASKHQCLQVVAHAAAGARSCPAAWPAASAEEAVRTHAQHARQQQNNGGNRTTAAAEQHAKRQRARLAAWPERASRENQVLYWTNGTVANVPLLVRHEIGLCVRLACLRSSSSTCPNEEIHRRCLPARTARDSAGHSIGKRGAAKEWQNWMPTGGGMQQGRGATAGVCRAVEEHTASIKPANSSSRALHLLAKI